MLGEAYPIEESEQLREEDMMFFTFTSVGRRDIDKLIAFTPIIRNGNKYYNWAFGDIYESPEGITLNDQYLTNNGDIKKVFYTVVSTLSIFFERYPNSTVIVKGSDERRTRFYISLIARHWAEIKLLYSVKMYFQKMTFEFNKEKECDYILISLLPDHNFE